MRLSQKGYRVGVLESGKRWTADDFPKTNWNARKYFWIPMLRCFGIQRITLLKGVMVLHGTGVGGGSLVYANTLIRPPSQMLTDPAWPRSVDWEKELEQYYELARRMLGVTTNPALEEGEQVLRKIGERMGAGGSFQPTEVGVFFGEPGEPVSDPYFSGKGPERRGCILCGGCMIGCRHGAKNSLDMNYLYFAEKWGAEIFAETSATRIRPVEDGYVIETHRPTSWFRRRGQDFRARKVILSAGVLGTVELLLRNRDRYGTLPNISQALGEQVRTNGESLLGATSFETHRDLSRGIAIGAAIHPDEHTKIESVRYSSGSGAMRLLGVPLTDDGTAITRPLKMFGAIIRRFGRFLRLMLVRDWARNSLILLVMQTLDRQMRLRLGRSILSGFRDSLQGAPTDKPIPSYMPVAQEAARMLADEIHGEPQNVISEVLLATPATAHILGGCRMGESAASGVIDLHHEVFGHAGLYVCDGSVIPVNLGVNPSLTITALAERFCSHFPGNPGTPLEILEERRIEFSRHNT